MKHLSEEELIEKYYEGPGSEARHSSGANSHLDTCVDCASAYAALKSDLNVLRAGDVPEQGADYGEQVWGRLARSLPALPMTQVRPRNLALWRGLSYAAGCAVLVVVAFYFGRTWEHRQPQTAVQRAVPQVQNHIVVVVLGDHLDRSEQLLVELKHADVENAAAVNPLRDEARSLLASNRVFRQNAVDSGDPALVKALDHLQQLLTELAGQPGGLDSADIARLQKEMNADGLLFEVRVLRSRIPHRQLTARAVAKGGTA